MLRNRLISDIVRRRAVGLPCEGSCCPATAIQQQISITDARMKLPVTVAALISLQQLDEFPSHFRGKLSGGETLHPFIGDRDQIAPNGPVTVTQFNSLSRRLQRRATGVEFERAVTKQAHGAYITAGWH